MEIAFELLANLIEAVISTQFYIRYFGCKEKYKSRFVALVLLTSHFSIISIVNYISFFHLLGEYILMAVSALLIIVFLRRKALEKTFIIGLLVNFQYVIILIMYSFFDRFMLYDENGFMVFGTVRILMVLFAKGMDIVFYEFLLFFKVKENDLLDNKSYLQLNAIVFSTLVAESFLMEIYYNISYGNVIHRDAVAAAVALLALNILIYVMCNRLSQNHIDLEKERMKSAAYENRMEDVKHAIEQHEQTMKIRHDMKNELLKIRMLLDEGKEEDTKHYIEDVLEVKLAERPIVFTENMLADAVINRSFEKCRARDIRIDFKIEGRIEKAYEMDMAVLLSNLLDNAIEASAKAEDRYIELRMWQNKDYRCIYIKNSYNGILIYQKDTLRTTKDDPAYHGYGISSIKEIVHKYDGVYHTQSSETEFVTEIHLYQPLE